ncbi:RNA-directed DNA polymerase [Erythrobacteraceae bacterium E2-1 Yellow Sea]|nr:RNA-directed DNA polymerase [Erythrobacteraceae bacterium E2-1 Yellow Sea]
MLLDELSAETGLRPDRLEYYADSASRRYYSFTIKKRNGDPRWIRHPAKPLKSLQRWLNSNVISRMRVHQCAMAYQPGSNIRSNALRHASSNFTVRIDFEDFFPSFKRSGIVKFLKDQEKFGLKLGRRDITFLSKIVTRFDELTIGAPSSPLLTNAMMYSFDKEVSEFCERKGLTYTRYADDIYISSVAPNGLDGVLQRVAAAAKKFPYAKLRINSSKTSYTSRRYRRMITGLVITPDHKISLGRKRKREIHSLVHMASVDKLDLEKLSYLQGMLAFTKDVEPSFFETLVAKYGRKTVERILL